MTRESRVATTSRDSTSADKKRITMEEQKALGNAEFKAGNYEKAIGFFTKAIDARRTTCSTNGRHATAALKEHAPYARTRRSASG